MEKRKCMCHMILTGRIYVHLMGCPEDYYSKEWETYSWWQKLWNRSPESLYLEHFKV